MVEGLQCPSVTASEESQRWIVQTHIIKVCCHTLMCCGWLLEAAF